MTDEMEKALEAAFRKYHHMAGTSYPPALMELAKQDLFAAFRSALAGEPEASVIERAVKVIVGVRPDATGTPPETQKYFEGYNDGLTQAVCNFRAAYPLIAAKWFSEVERLKEIALNYQRETEVMAGEASGWKAESELLTERLATAERERDEANHRTHKVVNCGSDGGSIVCEACGAYDRAITDKPCSTLRGDP